MGFVGQLYDFQQQAADQLLDWGGGLLSLTMGAGKVARVQEPVLTPLGWRPIGALNVGDEVIGSDGRATRVLGVYPQGTISSYEVSFSDGSATNCGMEHLWSVQSPSQKHQGAGYRTITLRQILEQGLRDKNDNLKYYIPMVEPVWFAPGDPLLLDPYALGVLLGDGSFAGGTPTLTNQRAAIREDVLQALDEIGVVGKTRGERANELRLCARAGRTNPLTKLLRGWGLWEHLSVDKFIPDEYLWAADPADRLALLQGLLDTDSEGDAGRASIAFTTSSPRLLEGVVHLVRSLGGVAKAPRSRIPTYSYRGEHRTGKRAYRTTIALPAGVSPTRHRPRIARSKYSPTRGIVDVQYTGEDKGVCIRVANEDGLYVTRNFILTHNTPTSIYVVEELLDAEEIEMALIVVPPNLRRQWRNQISIFAPDASVSLIEGTPKQRAQQYEWARENAEYTIIGYPALLNDWDHLQRLPTECIVADECQALKNFRAKRTRKMKRLGGEFRLGLTGQPLENRPEDIYSIMEWIAPRFLGRFDVYDQTYIVRDDWGRPLRYRNLDHLASRLRDEVMVRYSRADIADQLPERVYQKIDVPLDPKTNRVYGRIAADLLDWLTIAAEAGVTNFSLSQVYGRDESEESWEIRGEIAARLLALRMLCDHPNLLQISAQKFAVSGGEEGSEYVYDLTRQSDTSKLPTPKFDVAVELLQMILDEDPQNKVALFSFFKGNLYLLQERFPDVSVLYHGDVDARHKQHAVDAFNNDPRVRVFLSSDAGGSGVDLPAGNYHINYNLPFSAGQLAQRNARLDRVSSKHDRLTVINLLTEETVEKYYYEILVRRQALADAVLDNGAKRVRSVDMDLGSLRSFLLGSEDRV